VLTRTTAIGYYHQNLVGLCQRLTDHLADVPAGMPRERLWKVRARQVVLAQGAIERPLVFAGNDRPGVMLAGSARTYLNRYGVRVGERAVVATAHDTAWAAAFDLARAGTTVAMIVDVRRAVDDALLAEARSLGIESLCGGTVTETRGRLRVSAVRVNPVEPSGKVGDGRWIDCDALLMSGGWTPSLHLFSHTGGKLDWDEADQMFLPGRPTEDCRCVGAGTGRFGLAAALADGAAAGAAAATDAGFAASAPAFEALGEGPMAGTACRDLRPTATAPSPRPSSTSRTTCSPRTSASRSARASGRSSTSSATPRPAWPPTRARRRTSTAWRSRPTPSSGRRRPSA
jgi:sarcosine oxidase subunit alpha